MARALSNGNLMAALSDGITLMINRRGYSAAAAAPAMRRGSRAVEEKVVIGRREVESVDEEASSSWVPDPVTGYFRPANRPVEIDAAELREMLLSHKSRE